MKNRDELEECLEIALNALRCGEPDKCQAHVEKAYDMMVYGLPASCPICGAKNGCYCNHKKDELERAVL